jgi:hypothetical protein
MAGTGLERRHKKERIGKVQKWKEAVLERRK